jgi:hypothetical protein
MTRSHGTSQRTLASRLGRFALVIGTMAGFTASWLLAQAPPAPPDSAPRPTPPSAPMLVPPPPPNFAPQPAAMPPGPRRFEFKIDPKTPLNDLLPVPPRSPKTARPVTGNDLTKVPETQFQAPLKKDLAGEEGLKQTAHMFAKINHLNAKKVDGFLEALRGERKDLDGLPFAMGDACRTKGERSKQFANAVATVRGALRTRVTQAGFAPSPPPVVPAPGGAGAPVVPPSVPMTVFNAVAVVDSEVNDAFWERYLANCGQEDKELARVNRTQIEDVTLARIAALMQVLAPEAPSVRLGLVKYLSSVSHVEATRALVRLAIYSSEEEVHKAAVEALKVRRERDYTDALVQGLRYPWPTVANRTANTIVKLERTDLIPQLLDVLDEPDPRAPTTKDKVAVVRELVRVNHHKNCILCHAPGNTASVSPDSLTAAVPLPGEPLPSPADGYRSSHPDVLVRIDVTYLRQDFSAYQAVTDANPWPEMQRFDYLVRTRPVADEEAAAFREAFAKLEPNTPSPYQRAVLAALRELTGKDTEPTATAWRKLLNQPKGAKSGS